MPAPTASPIRVLIVDDHAVVRAGLCMLIESQPGLTVVGEAARRADALALAAAARPDIILLDVSLGDESGIDFLPELLEAATPARVILLTGVHDTQVQHRAVRFGAMGLVFKEQAAETLVRAIEKVYAGDVWLDRAMMASVIAEISRGGRPGERDPHAARIATLTERERQVIALICEGLHNKQIGQRLNLSETTVRHHLTSIFDQLGVTNRLELVIYAYRHGLAAPPH